MSATECPIDFQLAEGNLNQSSKHVQCHIYFEIKFLHRKKIPTGTKLHALYFVVLWRQVCPGMYYILLCCVHIYHGVTVGGMLWGKVHIMMYKLYLVMLLRRSYRIVMV